MEGIEKVIILAAGLGKRMREKGDVFLDKETEKFASRGLKSLIPLKSSKAFLDYLILNLEKANYSKICLVVNPYRKEFKNYFKKLSQRFSLKFYLAYQEKPKGTADALLKAKEFAKDESFLVVAGDNLYSTSVLKRIKSYQKDIWYIPGYDREGLIRKSNIEKERIKKFAVMEVEKGYLKKIIEKPKKIKKSHLLSMSIYRFTPEIFKACEKIKPHPQRKEYELTSAVQYGISKMGIKTKVFYLNDWVLDLTFRKDILSVREKIKEII